ncbi:protein of unknown function [Streptomyces murinus]
MACVGRGDFHSVRKPIPARTVQEMCRSVRMAREFRAMRERDRRLGGDAVRTEWPIPYRSCGGPV